MKAAGSVQPSTVGTQWLPFPTNASLHWQMCVCGPMCVHVAFWWQSFSDAEHGIHWQLSSSRLASGSKFVAFGFVQPR